MARILAAKPPFASKLASHLWRLALIWGLLSVLTGCAWFDLKQREVALRPTPGRPADADSPARWRPGDERFTQPAAATPGEQIALWWLPQPDPQAPTLLYLHGTFRTLYGNQPKIDALRDAGFAILAVDYRGWGDATALVPSEETIVADAWQAWAELKRRQPDPKKRVIFGHSMGGAVAVTLASQLHRDSDYAALVLEATFNRIADVAAAAGFWGRIGAAITTLDFNSAAKIGKVDAPVLMLHGTADKTVPIEVGRKLRDAAPPGTRWMEVPGGTHSRLQSDAPALYQQTFKDLRATLSPSP